MLNYSVIWRNFRSLTSFVRTSEDQIFVMQKPFKHHHPLPALSIITMHSAECTFPVREWCWVFEDVRLNLPSMEYMSQCKKSPLNCGICKWKSFKLQYLQMDTLQACKVSISGWCCWLSHRVCRALQEQSVCLSPMNRDLERYSIPDAFNQKLVKQI